MSKQVNRVNIEPEILHGNWSSYWLLVKLTGHTYTMQELVKEVTVINHSNNGFAILHGKLSP